MKAYDFDAVTFDGEVYCIECLPDGVNVNDEEVSPIFADCEHDAFPTCGVCGRVHDYVPLTAYGERYEQEQAGLQEEDITISDSGPLGSLYSVGIVNGKFIGEYKTRDAAETAIRTWMEENQFWPNVWIISDHGNAELVILTPKED